MARQEHSREDLLRDARNLTPRCRLRLHAPADPEPVFCGFRGAAISIYFGEDPAYHFNPAGELRRAYVAGRLIKAESGNLVAMVRERTDDATSLVSRELPADETQRFLATMQERLAALATALAQGAYDPDGEVPPGADVVPRLAQWLAEHGQIAVAASPRVGA